MDIHSLSEKMDSQGKSNAKLIIKAELLGNVLVFRSFHYFSFSPFFKCSYSDHLQGSFGSKRSAPMSACFLYIKWKPSMILLDKITVDEQSISGS